MSFLRALSLAIGLTNLSGSQSPGILIVTCKFYISEIKIRKSRTIRK